MRVILSGAKDPTYDVWIAHVWKRDHRAGAGSLVVSATRDEREAKKRTPVQALMSILAIDSRGKFNHS